MSEYCECGAIKYGPNCRAMHDRTKPPKPEITKRRVVDRLNGVAQLLRANAAQERRNLMNANPRAVEKRLLTIADALEAEAKFIDGFFR